MYQIRILDESSKVKISTIAELHKHAFPDFFLTQLGIPFLRTLYFCYTEDSESGIIVAEDSGQIKGFIAYSKDYPRFYNQLIKKHLLRFAFCSLGAAIRHPSFIKRLLRAFNKSHEVKKEEAYIELASICVDPKEEGKGIGTRLIDKMKAITDFSFYAYINLETDACENDAVNKFYINNGFRLNRSYVTAEGRRMNEYRYYGEKR